MRTQRRIDRRGPYVMKDAQGNTYRVYRDVEQMRPELLADGPGPWLDGIGHLSTDRGEPVNELDDGWYEIVTRGTRIRPDQPLP